MWKRIFTTVSDRMLKTQTVLKVKFLWPNADSEDKDHNAFLNRTNFCLLVVLLLCEVLDLLATGLFHVLSCLLSYCCVRRVLCLALLLAELSKPIYAEWTLLPLKRPFLFRRCLVSFYYFHILYKFLLVLGLTTRQPLWVILCRLPEKGRKEIE